MTSLRKPTPTQRASKELQRLADRAESVISELDTPDIKQLRKEASAFAKDVRKQAERAKKQALKAAPSRDELAERRDQAMEGAAAAAGVILPLVPAVARRIATNRRARHMALAAPRVAFRSNPIILGASVASAGFLGYRWWKRRRAQQQHEARQEWEYNKGVARMDNEGPMPGAYVPEKPARRYSTSGIGNGNGSH